MRNAAVRGASPKKPDTPSPPVGARGFHLLDLAALVVGYSLPALLILLGKSLP
jgi:hypothetical protein